MQGRQGREGVPRTVFGCLAVAIVLVVAAGVFLVVFL
jgi:hypothetical protein